MQWAEALKEVSVVESAGADVEIVSVEYDSRRVKAGSAFVAMRGGTTDGNRYIDAAVDQGAVAILTDSREGFVSVKDRYPAIAVAQVEHGRRALAELSAAVLGHPERKLAISAVTGTNGKTTTAYLLEQLLRSAGRECVLIGTIETHVGDEVRVSEHTTPESSDLLKIFADGVAAGATEAVMEMSSHALDQERVWGIPVDVAMFTNLTQDHLDYHGTMDRYAAAKARLFEGVGTQAPRTAIINLNDFAVGRMTRAAEGCAQMWTYGVGQYVPEIDAADIHGDHADYQARHVMLGAAGTSFELETPFGIFEVESRLVGMVNVHNLIAAMAAAVARGLTMDAVVKAAATLRAVPGRFETVANDLGITVVVDYAHTDDALRNLIALGRELVVAGGGRVITLFGCGGDRDRTKRPRMGRAAAEGSDLVVLTSDNPRGEEPMAIIAEALVGVRETATECRVEPDRAAAIEVAIRAARAGDIVLLAGKGHEKVQILRHGTVPFDDVAVAENVLRELR
ncbi:MAG TPA: UDP-N-acetylmuramoyl-L-alanyl-D-glutamate--2,6-diaminopimelate ligase [Acidobacteriaceae bacterium]|nr:UDP-N-acetylmuramoyl-L-alanyl-D-glutamate--2,6-diaminopimelate ligase [Acidobacteriaceae bacterium]